MKAFLDGLASLLAALATLAICGGPAYFTYQAIQSMIAPAWVWVSVAALAGIGIVLTIAFLRQSSRAANPNSVPSVQQSMLDMRQAGVHISVTGGVFDGFAAGERTAFVATPDNRLVCTFQSAPDPTRAGLTATVTGHRLTVPGIYGALSGAVLPNISTLETSTTEAFVVETGAGGSATTTSIGVNDPRLQALLAFFRANLTPCWSFG
ncbi:hypothetical protein N8315_04085 [Octadecabacter sp.]|nr:hypothetical protein [Octadecabacter sp.]